MTLAALPQAVLDDLNDALLAMQAALLGRSLYGSNHPTISKHLDRAAEALDRAQRAHRHPVRVLAIDGRVMVGNHRLAASDQLSQSLFGMLGRGGVDGLTLTPGIDAHEIAAFLDPLPDDPQATPTKITGTAHIRPACIDDEHGDGDHAPGIVLASPDDTRTAAEQFGPALDALAQGRGTDHDQLGQLVDQISSAVTVGGDAMLPMADLKRHDEYTFIHTVNVGILAAGLAEAVGLDAAAVQDITLSALLHDVGKKKTPLEVLNKAGKLEEDEMRIVRRHPADGARILFDTPGVPDIAAVIAFEHHIHLDGSGYPHVRPGYRPHLGSQIVQLADVFDALRTHRPYRKALPLTKTLEILGKGGGDHYDRELLAVFFERVIIRSTRDATPDTPGKTMPTHAA